MSLQKQIDQDLTKAMTDQDEATVSVLRMVKSAIQNQAIADKKKELTDEVVARVVTAQAKKRKESIVAFQKGGRDDLAAKEEAELKVIEKYLPRQMSEDEIKKIVQEVVTGLGEEKNFGQVMKQVMSKLAGQADGKLVSKIVKESLD